MTRRLQGTRPPPALDPRVVAGQKRFGDREPPKLAGARVMGVIEALPDERLPLDGLSARDDPGNQAREPLDDRESGGFPAGKHEVAQGNLLVEEAELPGA